MMKKMKFTGLLVLSFLLLLGSHDDSIPFYGIGGSFQSQSHYPFMSTLNSSSQSARPTKPEYSLPHGPDSVVCCEWTFQVQWFQASFVIDILIVFLAVSITISCFFICILILTFAGLSSVVNRIQPSPSCLQQSGMNQGC